MSQCVHACSDTLLCLALLWLHGLQHARFPCPSLSSTFWSNSWPFSQWCCLTISSSATLFSFAFNLPQHQDLFQWANSSLTFGHIRWPKFWSFGFTISLSNEYSRLISFSIDWFDLLVVQGTLKSLIQHHSSKALILQISAFSIVQLSHPHKTTGKSITFD